MRRHIVWVFGLVAACGGSSPGGQAVQGTDAGTGRAASVSPTQSPSVTCAGLASDAAVRDIVFKTLSARSWRAPYCSSYAPTVTCDSLMLSPSGRYSLRSSQHEPMRDDIGSWNFAAIDRTHGIVCLDGRSAAPATVRAETNLPSAIFFSLEQDSTLTFGRYRFAPADANPGTQDAAALPDVHVPEGFARLVGRTWRKTNAFDLFMAAEEIVFNNVGRFSATYRGGTCVHGGYISWDKDMLLAVSEANQCDTRGPTTAFIASPNAVPEFIDDMVVMSQSAYHPVGTGGEKNVLVFDPYGRSLRVSGVFEGTLHSGLATTIELAFKNMDPALERTLGKFEIAIRPATASAGGFSTAGAKTILATSSLDSPPLAPGGTYKTKVSITPPSAGDTFALEIAVDFRDAHEQFHGEHTFITAILP